MMPIVRPSPILLPASGTPFETWAVVACDQFTSQPEYWREAESLVGDRPSTLKMILPEAWLSEREQRTPAIHRAMEAALRDGAVAQAVNGFVLVERTTASGARLGLVAAVDLEQYDPSPAARTAIRCSEGTVAERVPPRAAVRRGAALDIPHAMMLLDDPEGTVVEALYARREALRPLYDFEVMLGGGHLRGWAVEGSDADRAIAAIGALDAAGDGLTMAVGDGNHSLAAARMCWEEIRANLSEEARANHPARWALAELVNLHEESLLFEPIHRLVAGADARALLEETEAFLIGQGAVSCPEAEADLFAFGGGRTLSLRLPVPPLEVLQPFLDGWLANHPEAGIDYIHGDDALRALVGEASDRTGFMPRVIGKGEFFDTLRRSGALPRKSFSMGEACEKRYYMEARRLLG